ncbi:MAG TPA: YeeE/YedE thiosulfate transporter family protein [Kofleriaceae bacterium]
MHDFTPVAGLAGGILIALGLAVVLLGSGRIVGLSGVTAGLLNPHAGNDRAWRASFLVGALAVGAIFELASPTTYDAAAPRSLWVLAVSGVLVGLGTRMANGCTSGHGLCGVARLSKRSLIATITFFAVGVATATLVGRLA